MSSAVFSIFVLVPPMVQDLSCFSACSKGFWVFWAFSFFCCCSTLDQNVPSTTNTHTEKLKRGSTTSEEKTQSSTFLVRLMYPTSQTFWTHLLIYCFFFIFNTIYIIELRHQSMNEHKWNIVVNKSYFTLLFLSVKLIDRKPKACSNVNKWKGGYFEKSTI